MWTVSQLYAGVSIEDEGGSMEVTEVYSHDDGTVTVTGIRNSDGEEDSFEMGGDLPVKVVSF